MSDRPEAPVSERAGPCVRSTWIEDAGVQAAMQPWFSMECVQLGRGRRVGRLDLMEFGNREIVWELQDTPVQKLGITEPNLCTVSYCTPDSTSRINEFGGDADMFFLPENTEFDIYVPAGAQTTYVALDQAEFLADARVLNPTEWDRKPEELCRITAGRPGELQSALEIWLEGARTISDPRSSLDAGAAHEILRRSILQIVTGARIGDPQLSSLDRSRAHRICRQARLFVEECLSDGVVPGIVDICRWLRVSARTLQYAFREYVDMSPTAYLRTCRLNRVRAVLLASDPRVGSVTEVATRFGFLHLGRFSVDYRRVFDETPSTTLRRC